MSNIPKARYCKVCKARFKPDTIFQWWCCEEHKADYAVMLVGKQREQRAKAQQRKLDKAQKEERKQLRARKQALKTKPKWKAEAQVAFNRYVRIRDAGKPCISCGSTPAQKFGGTMDCGHYRTRGCAAHLSFHLHNAAGQCVRCNRDQSGAQKAFEQGLIERIGLEKVEALNNNNAPRTFTIEYYQRIKSIFTRKARRLEKRRANQLEVAA
ncbi:recombination protein NinG [Serratia marcescens]|uniref:Recombination protein NinG n=1 Tax=Serratia marcescens TaxID=615 RepID=A0A9X8VLJ4_SERMA|nr:recombination protein NinG [Serratia marcescens]